MMMTYQDMMAKSASKHEVRSNIGLICCFKLGSSIIMNKKQAWHKLGLFLSAHKLDDSGNVPCSTQWLVASS